MAQSQKAYRLPSKGAGYEALQQSSEAIPTPQAHEVLLEVHATTLNYRDLVIANGGYPFPVKNNVVPLSDGAGVIVAVGDQVEGLVKGDWAISNFDITNMAGPQKDWEHGLGGPIDGMLRRYVAIPASAIVKIPKSTKLKWAELAALVCTGTTAWNALYGNLPLRPGQTVLFQGTGGVSMTGLLLAKAAGAITIITSSSDQKLQMAKQKYGADYTINYKTTPNWAAEANKITEGRGVDIILENGGSGTIGQSIECIARGGQIAVIGFLSAADQKDMPDVASLVLGKGCVVRGVNVGAKQFTEDLVQFVCSKNLAIPIDKTFAFDQAVDAYRELEKAGHVGKIAVVME